MTSKQVNLRADQAAIFKALGHPARLTMVAALGKRPHCVCELRELVGSDMSTVSKHLTVLRNAGLVSADKNGKQMIYTLRLPCTLGFLDCVNRALKERRQ